MLNDRPSILTLEHKGNVIAEAKVFGMNDAYDKAKKLKEEYGFDADAPVCFIHIESEMNFKNIENESVHS